MRAARRRQRTIDQLESPEAIRRICRQLHERMPNLVPKSEQELVRFLYAIRHVERRSATNTRRGRPTRWKREDLLKAAGELRSFLERETSGRISLSSFIGQYLQVLQFPSDLNTALSIGSINLQEAVQLSRLTPHRLCVSVPTARARRTELLQQHLAVQGSQTRLRERVKEILGETHIQMISSNNMTQVVAQVDELFDIDPQDSRHLFWE